MIWIIGFDRWGIKLSKQLANKILPEHACDSPSESHDSSTNGLINTLKKMRQGNKFSMRDIE
jgi:glucose-6-phosphate isomerase